MAQRLAINLKQLQLLVKRRTFQRRRSNYVSYDEISEIIDDVKAPEKIMRYYKWPQDFKCEKCSLINECLQFDFLKIMKNIQKKHKEANINHQSLNL